MKPKYAFSAASEPRPQPQQPLASLPEEDRMALQKELQAMHARGLSDYQLADTFSVSPGAVNKARVHAQVGTKVATAIYAALGTTPAELATKHPPTRTEGCHMCERRRAPRAGKMALPAICPRHVAMIHRMLGYIPGGDGDN